MRVRWSFVIAALILATGGRWPPQPVHGQADPTDCVVYCPEPVHTRCDNTNACSGTTGGGGGGGTARRVPDYAAYNRAMAGYNAKIAEITTAIEAGDHVAVVRLYKQALKFMNTKGGRTNLKKWEKVVAEESYASRQASRRSAAALKQQQKAQEAANHVDNLHPISLPALEPDEAGLLAALMQIAPLNRFSVNGPGAPVGAGTSPVAVPAMMSGDPMVVDARVVSSGAGMVAAIPELARSPQSDRIAKGFSEIIKHNWPAALAWWQDALNRDPNNSALRNGVELAQWTIAYQIRTGTGTLTREYINAYKTAYLPDAKQDRANADRMIELITGKPAIDLSDEWWRDHSK